MRPSQAEAFLAVLESGSIIDAARHLNRSRTTISAAISALEDDLNAELFERSGKAVRATDLAWAIQPDCMRLIQTYRQIQARCELERGGIETTLRLARDDALPEAVWLEAMHALKQHFPLTGISVYLAPPQELLWQTFSSFHFSNESKGQVTLRLEEILAKYLTQFS